jgi:hypothetical protein
VPAGRCSTPCPRSYRRPVNHYGLMAIPYASCPGLQLNSSVARRLGLGVAPSSKRLPCPAGDARASQIQRQAQVTTSCRQRRLPGPLDTICCGQVRCSEFLRQRCQVPPSRSPSGRPGAATQRSAAVNHGALGQRHPQINGRIGRDGARRTVYGMQAGQGLEGPLTSAADGQQPTAVGSCRTAGKASRIVGSPRRWDLRSPAVFSPSSTILNRATYRPGEARWI